MAEGTCVIQGVQKDSRGARRALVLPLGVERSFANAANRVQFAPSPFLGRCVPWTSRNWTCLALGSNLCGFLRLRSGASSPKPEGDHVAAWRQSIWQLRKNNISSVSLTSITAFFAGSATEPRSVTKPVINGTIKPSSRLRFLSWFDSFANYRLVSILPYTLASD
jgi:hypothetical protein